MVLDVLPTGELIMSMEVIIKGRYLESADQLFERACLADEAPGPDGSSISRLEKGGIYYTEMAAQGFFNFRKHQAEIRMICYAARIVESKETDGAIRLWRHRLHIKPMNAGAVWVDRIIIDAGIMTPILARYAKYIYKKRHKRRNVIAVETFVSRSYRAIKSGLPTFQAAD